MKKWYLANFPFGVFLGAVFASGIAITLDAEIATEWKGYVTWGGTTLATLFAASLAVLGVLANLAKQNAIEEERRARKFRSSKAFLPLTLSEMLSSIRFGIQNASSLQEKAHGEGSATTRDEHEARLALTSEVTSVLRDLIENSPDEKLSKYIALLLGAYQVGLARWRGVFEAPKHLESPASKRERLAYWAYLYSMGEGLFDYARNERETVLPPDEDFSVSRSLRLADLPDAQTEHMDQDCELMLRKLLREVNELR